MKEYARLKIEGKGNIENWRLRLIPKNGKILDAGCAGGALSRFIEKKRYYGIDINPYLIKECQSRGLKIKKGSITKIPFGSNIFSGIYCSHVIEHLGVRDQQKAMNEFFRVLKKKGKIVLFAPTPYNWYFFDDPTHERPLTHGSLSIIAKNAGFTQVKTFYTKVRFLPEFIQRYLRVIPLPFLFWEVGIVATKP